ncbi:hypothetical protein S245_027154, partial [Arachis hypogaea]
MRGFTTPAPCCPSQPIKGRHVSARPCVMSQHASHVLWPTQHAPRAESTRPRRDYATWQLLILYYRKSSTSYRTRTEHTYSRARTDPSTGTIARKAGI